MFESFPIEKQQQMLMEKMVKLKHIPHAVAINCNNHNVGFDLATALASAIICENEFCGSCADCKNVINNNHVDVKVVQKETDKSEITIDKIREIKKDMYILPTVANCKVYIIDDAHLMNTNSQNALLKSLEEPVENVFFM